jgi:CheY-like chemotaxis protein
MAGRNPKTILLVEDEAIIGLSVTMTLKQSGFAVILAMSGEKAVEVVDNHPEIGLVLMDINLGKGMNGTEAARLILQNMRCLSFFTHPTPSPMWWRRPKALPLTDT